MIRNELPLSTTPLLEGVVPFKSTLPPIDWVDLGPYDDITIPFGEIYEAEVLS